MNTFKVFGSSCTARPGNWHATRSDCRVSRRDFHSSRVSPWLPAEYTEILIELIIYVGLIFDQFLVFYRLWSYYALRTTLSRVIFVCSPQNDASGAEIIPHVVRRTQTPIFCTRVGKLVSQIILIDLHRVTYTRNKVSAESV